MTCGQIQPLDAGGTGHIGYAYCCPWFHAPHHEPDAPTFNQMGVDFFLFEEFRAGRRTGGGDPPGGDPPSGQPHDWNDVPDFDPPGDDPDPPGGDPPGGDIPDFPWDPPGGKPPGDIPGGGGVDIPGGQPPAGGGIDTVPW